MKVRRMVLDYMRWKVEHTVDGRATASIRHVVEFNRKHGGFDRYLLPSERAEMMSLLKKIAEETGAWIRISQNATKFIFDRYVLKEYLERELKRLRVKAIR